jgi:HEAT repeat protein
VKVIEQLVEYLKARRLLTVENCEWLCAQGFLPVSRYGSEMEYDNRAYADDDQDFDREEPGELVDFDKIDEELRQQDRARKSDLPPTSSKGARRSRRQRANARSEGRQARDAARMRAKAAAVRRLDGLTAESAIPALVSALSDPRSEVRCCAAKVLHRIGSPAADAAAMSLRIALEDSDFTVACAAAGALSGLGSEAWCLATPFLLRAISHHEPWCRSSAIESLAQIKTPPPEVLVAITKCLEDPQGSVRQCAEEALRVSSQRVERAVYALVVELSNPSALSRAIAARELGGIGSKVAPVAVPALIALLADTAWAVRLNAAEALGQIGSSIVDISVPVPDATTTRDLTPVGCLPGDSQKRLIIAAAETIIPALIDLIDDSESSVCIAAAKALGNIGLPGISALIACLESEKFRFAVEALVHVGPLAADADPTLIPTLTILLDDSNTEVRSIAATALSYQGQAAASALPALIARLEDIQPLVREIAAKVIGQVGSPAGIKAVPGLILASRDAETRVRRSAVETLGIIGFLAVDDCVPAIATALEDPDDDVMRQAANALVRLVKAGVTSALSALVSALQSFSPNVRRVAQAKFNFALATVGASDAILYPPLISLLADPNPDVRRAVILALGRIGAAAKSAVPALQVCLNDTDPHARSWAADAIQKIEKG